MNRLFHRRYLIVRRNCVTAERWHVQSIQKCTQVRYGVAAALAAAPKQQIKFGTGCVWHMKNKKISAQSIRCRKKPSTMRSAVCTINSSTTAQPSSRKCSPTCRKSAVPGCFEARISSLSTRKYRIHSVRFNSLPSFSSREVLILILLYRPVTNSTNSSAGGNRKRQGYSIQTVMTWLLGNLWFNPRYHRGSRCGKITPSK